jgi:anhydro-N-acetylmuramic acid kinase
MSGTSLDGVDAALADFATTQPRVVASHFLPYPRELREALLAVHAADATLDEAARLANEVTQLYAQAALQLKARADGVVAVGCHGQTVRHEPARGYTVQLVNGAMLAERTTLTTVVDFRSRDIAAGGQGAPLVPAFHAACFADASRNRVILNLGGIANVTRLPARGDVIGFDTGPANILLDAWMRQRFSRAQDEGGCIASTGKVMAPLLSQMLADEYLALAPPKSTGRDLYNDDWLRRFELESYRPEDVLATLVEFSALSVAQAIRAYCPGTVEVFACGGGVHNVELMKRLAANLPGIHTGSTLELGLDPDWVEAMAFAWLAKQALDGAAGNLPAVTGARGPRVLGAIYPA